VALSEWERRVDIKKAAAPELPDGFQSLPLRPAGFIDAIGPLFGRWEGDRFVLGLRVEERHCNSSGTCHGGMMAALADMLFAMGANLQGDLSRFLPTISLTCDFIGPANLGDWIEGRLDILHKTRLLLFAQGLLTVQDRVILRSSGVLKIPTEPDQRYNRDTFLPRA
jgi:uncharacterized protein (TIGR00369 family)